MRYFGKEGGVTYMSNYLKGNKGKRKKIAEHIIEEIQGSQIQSSKGLVEVLKNELNNFSDVAIDIRFRQTNQYD